MGFPTPNITRIKAEVAVTEDGWGLRAQTNVTEAIKRLDIKNEQTIDEIHDTIQAKIFNELWEYSDVIDRRAAD